MASKANRTIAQFFNFSGYSVMVDGGTISSSQQNNMKTGLWLLLQLATSLVRSNGSKNQSLRGNAAEASGRNLQEAPGCTPLPTNKYLQLVNRDTRLVMHVTGGSQAPGAAVIQEYQDEGTHDNFRLISSGFGGYYHIIAQHSGLALAGEIVVVSRVGGVIIISKRCLTTRSSCFSLASLFIQFREAAEP
jgi:Ricin-type beta-trefoil lectin domain-like